MWPWFDMKDVVNRLSFPVSWVLEFFFSRAGWCLGVSRRPTDLRPKAEITSCLTETGNRAWKVSGTQGTFCENKQNYQIEIPVFSLTPRLLLRIRGTHVPSISLQACFGPSITFYLITRVWTFYPRNYAPRNCTKHSVGTGTWSCSLFLTFGY